MMAPIPIAVMLKGPSAFERPCSAVSSLAFIAASDLRVITPWSLMSHPDGPALTSKDGKSSKG